jgi:Zn finger protein HypA/HybF involved in hydrogenase expression
MDKIDIRHSCMHAYVNPFIKWCRKCGEYIDVSEKQNMIRCPTCNSQIRGKAR